jgi:GT2 family glycosyltransferase
MFGVALNYFSKPQYPPSVKQSAKFALSLLKNCPEVTSVILVDGSKDVDKELCQYCVSLGFTYKHTGKILSFAEGYNLGISLLKEDWVVTMASDIYVYPNTFYRFRQFIENHKELTIGCLIPHLSKCDFPLQTKGYAHSCYSPLMTLNLNVFPRSVFEKIGGISTEYTGNFNDVDTVLKLKQLGLNIFLVDTNASHYGRLTTQQGSNTSTLADKNLFYSNFPALKSDNGLWNLRIDKFIKNPLLKLAFLLFPKIPFNFLRNRLLSFSYTMIYILQKVE